MCWNLRACYCRADKLRARGWVISRPACVFENITPSCNKSSTLSCTKCNLPLYWIDFKLVPPYILYLCLWWPLCLLSSPWGNILKVSNSVWSTSKFSYTASNLDAQVVVALILWDPCMQVVPAYHLAPDAGWGQSLLSKSIKHASLIPFGWPSCTWSMTICFVSLISSCKIWALSYLTLLSWQAYYSSEVCRARGSVTVHGNVPRSFPTP